MKRFVTVTAVLSIIAGIAVQFPEIAARMLPSQPPGMLVHLFGAMAIFLGVMLLLCARNLRARGVLVAWEGVLRIGGFAIMAGYGLFGGGGASMIGSGVFDLAIGLAYLILLPRHLGVSLINLLLDRPHKLI